MTYVFPFLVVVPQHGGTFAAEASDTVDSFLGCAVFVEFEYRLIFPRTIHCRHTDFRAECRSLLDLVFTFDDLQGSGVTHDVARSFKK